MPSSAAVRVLAVAAVAGVLFAAGAGPVLAHEAVQRTDGDVVVAPSGERWVWPVASPFRLEDPYEAPAHEYGPGHRGVDLHPLDDVSVRSPAAGVIAFSGDVAGRGVVTIDHGGGLVTTLEPVESAPAPGTPVARGEEIGVLGVGGHARPGRVHFGVRLEGEYVNPLLLLGGVPRAVLLPCC